MTLEIWTWHLVVAGGTTEDLWALIGVSKDLYVFGYIAETDPTFALLFFHFTGQSSGYPEQTIKSLNMQTISLPLCLSSHLSPARFSSSLLYMCTTYMTSTAWLSIYPGFHEKLWSGFGLQWYARVYSQGNRVILPANLWIFLKKPGWVTSVFITWERLTVILNLDE